MHYLLHNHLLFRARQSERLGVDMGLPLLKNTWEIYTHTPPPAAPARHPPMGCQEFGPWIGAKA
jgi:hypothetical protein